MRYRPLLKSSQWAELTGIPSNEEELIRQHTLNGEDIDRSLSKRGQRNQLGFAIQLCLMRFPGRALGHLPFPGTGVVERKGRTYRFVTAEIQSAGANLPGGPASIISIARHHKRIRSRL